MMSSPPASHVLLLQRDMTFCLYTMELLPPRPNKNSWGGGMLAPTMTSNVYKEKRPKESKMGEHRW